MILPKKRDHPTDIIARFPGHQFSSHVSAKSTDKSDETAAHGTWETV